MATISQGFLGTANLGRPPTPFGERAPAGEEY